MGKQQISLQIPDETYEFVKKHGWNHKEVYLLGVQAKQDNPQLIRRINESDNAIEKLQRKITSLSQEIAERKKEVGDDDD